MNSETIYYRSPIGIIEIKNDDDAIAAILFVNSWKGKKIDESDIPFTTPSSLVIKTTIKELDEYFAGERKDFSFKMKQNGTEFQQKVWNELLHISYAKTISYLELSKRIGNVKAIRAAGTANGNNNICIAVPCHRVIGSDGSLVGYGGDLWRKKWLLDHEAKFGNGVISLFDN